MTMELRMSGFHVLAKPGARAADTLTLCAPGAPGELQRPQVDSRDLWQDGARPGGPRLAFRTVTCREFLRLWTRQEFRKLPGLSQHRLTLF